MTGLPSSGFAARIVTLIALLGAPAGGAATAGAAGSAGTCWPPPVAAPIALAFVGPVCPWCPGHRGVEFATGASIVVTASTGGQVAFAGTVVGVGYVTVREPGGLLVTYGRVTPAVRAGSTIAAGQVVGLTSGALFLSIRRGETYLDPAGFIGELRWPTRLIPTDGSPGPPAGPPSLHCRGAPVG